MNMIVGRVRKLAGPRWKPRWLLRAGAIGCALLALALLLLTRASAPDPVGAATLTGHSAPSFALPIAQGGKTQPEPGGYAATANGKPTLLVFFNTLCVHCLSEIPAAQHAANAMPNAPLNVIFIDSPGENAKITGAYMARQRLDPPVLLDAGARVARAYHASYTPTIILIDGAGVVRRVWTGETSAATLNAGITAALGP